MEKIIHLKLKNFNETQIVFENLNYAIVFKPANIPTAPLYEKEPGTLLEWFLRQRPEARTVIGYKKAIEHGLLHRLDTATSGLVLVAKKISAYNRLLYLQDKNLITKTYQAFCDLCNFEKIFQQPFYIISKFRPFGRGAKKVKAVFLNTNEAKRIKGKIYKTKILKISELNSNFSKIFIEIKKGYRHQIRCHLSSYNMPILGDELYNNDCKHKRLQLFAVGLSFPENDNANKITHYRIDGPKRILN